MSHSILEALRSLYCLANKTSGPATSTDWLLGRKGAGLGVAADQQPEVSVPAAISQAPHTPWRRHVLGNNTDGLISDAWRCV